MCPQAYVWLAIHQKRVLELCTINPRISEPHLQYVKSRFIWNAGSDNVIITWHYGAHAAITQCIEWQRVHAESVSCFITGEQVGYFNHARKREKQKTIYKRETVVYYIFSCVAIVFYCQNVSFHIYKIFTYMKWGQSQPFQICEGLQYIIIITNKQQWNHNYNK